MKKRLLFCLLDAAGVLIGSRVGDISVVSGVTIDIRPGAGLVLISADWGLNCTPLSRQKNGDLKVDAS
jgi:hypothetical protein